VKAPEYIAAYFGYALTDYGRAGDGLMLSSGAGLMMAAMDVCQRVRWCVDIDAVRPLWSRLPELMVALDRNCGLGVLVVTGAFLADKPDQLRAGLARLTLTPAVAYCARQRNFPDEALTLTELAARVAAARRLTPQTAHFQQQRAWWMPEPETASIRRERERLRSLEEPAPRPACEPIGLHVVDRNTIDEAHEPDDAAGRHRRHAAELVALADAVEGLGVGMQCGDDQQHATVRRLPISILNPLDAVDDQCSPRLANG